MNYREYKKTKEEIENNFRELEHLKVEKLEEEIERLNNIINEFEKWLKAHLDDEFYWFKMYDKLQELKGDSSNE